MELLDNIKLVKLPGLNKAQSELGTLVLTTLSWKQIPLKGLGQASKFALLELPDLFLLLSTCLNPIMLVSPKLYYSPSHSVLSGKIHLPLCWAHAYCFCPNADMDSNLNVALILPMKYSMCQRIPGRSLQPPVYSRKRILRFSANDIKKTKRYPDRAVNSFAV